MIRDTSQQDAVIAPPAGAGIKRGAIWIGAAAALPCVAGTFSSVTGLAAPEECSACPLGAACSTGATEAGALAQSKVRVGAPVRVRVLVTARVPVRVSPCPRLGLAAPARPPTASEAH